MKVWAFMKKPIASVVALCLCASGVTVATQVPTASAADGEVVEENLLYMVDDNWGFYYTTYSDGTAEITGSNEASGETKIELPDAIIPAISSESQDSSSYTVTSIADSSTDTVMGGLAYTTREALEELKLPSQLVTIGSYAFYGCQITSLTVPASVWSIGDACFRTCSALADIDFQGTYMGYLGESAFRSCTSLTEVVIPALLRSSSGNTADSAQALQSNCFNGCTSLQTVYFLAGNPSGASSYILDGSQSGKGPGTVFLNCDDIETLVFFCGGSTFRGSGSSFSDSSLNLDDTYYTIDFFSSEDAYQAATTTVAGPDGKSYAYYDSSKALGSLTYKKGTKIEDLLNKVEGTKKNMFTSETHPELSSRDTWPPNVPVEAGSDAIWYVEPTTSSSSSDNGQYGGPNGQGDSGTTTTDTSTLSDSTYAYPVSKYDLTYCQISAKSSYSVASGEYVDLSDVAVYADDGALVDPSYYDLVCYQLAYTTTQDDRGNVTTTYYDYDDPNHPGSPVGFDAVGETGRYTVVATGTKDVNEGTIATATFSVTLYTPETTTYSGGASSISTSVLNDQNSSVQAPFNVVADSDDWKAALVGSVLASMGNGTLMLSEGTNGTGQTFYKALDSSASKSGAVDIYVVESYGRSVSTKIGNSLSDLSNVESVTRLPLGEYGDGLGYNNDDDRERVTAQELSVDVYETVRDFPEVFGGSWSDVAVVASGVRQRSAAAASELACAQGAALFLTDDDGALDASTLNLIKEGGFKTVQIVGGTDYVLASVQNSLANSGLDVVRIGDSSASAFERSLAVAEYLMEDGIASSSVTYCVDPAQTSLSCQASTAAVHDGGIVLTPSTTIDEKALQNWIAQRGKKTVESVILYDPSETLTERLDAFYTTSPLSTEAVDGDTVDLYGLLFTLVDGVLSFEEDIAEDIPSTSTITFANDTVDYLGYTFKVQSGFSYTGTRQVKGDDGDGGNGGTGGNGGGGGNGTKADKGTTAKKAQNIKVKPAKKVLKAKKLKKKAAKVVFKVTGAKGKLSAKTVGKKSKKALKVKVKGKKKLVVKLKKKTKKGTYKIRLFAKATSAYNVSPTKTIKVKVK